jgi:hypothetical protein
MRTDLSKFIVVLAAIALGIGTSAIGSARRAERPAQTCETTPGASTAMR